MLTRTLLPCLFFCYYRSYHVVRVSSNSVSGNGKRVALSIHLPHWHKCMELSVSLVFFCTCIFIVDFRRPPKAFIRQVLPRTCSQRFGTYCFRRRGLVTQMSEAEKQRIDEDAKEFFAARNLDQAEMDSDKLLHSFLPYTLWSISYRFRFICISHITHSWLSGRLRTSLPAFLIFCTLYDFSTFYFLS